MKRIIILSIILSIVSFFVIITYGKEASFKYDVKDIENIDVNYDKKIISGL